MKRIWTPWRRKYIEALTPNDDCVFCTAIKNADKPESLVFHEGPLTFVIVNRFPYSTGHVMVVPKAHVRDLDEMDVETRHEMIETLTQVKLLLKQVYKPHGMNLGANLGSAAGAGVPGHFHFHVVPRWVGDNNFMSAVGETRILPEEVEFTRERLKKIWDATPDFLNALPTDSQN